MAEGANTKEAEKHLELTPGELFNKLYKEQNGIETDSNHSKIKSLSPVSNHPALWVAERVGWN